jgi:hypothetical protein
MYVTLHNYNDTITCKHAMIDKKIMLVFTVHTTTKTIKISFDDNDFKIAHPSDFFFSRTITINF